MLNSNYKELLDPPQAADCLYAIMPETLKHYWFLPDAGTCAANGEVRVSVTIK